MKLPPLIPHSSARILNPDGTPTDVWYKYLQGWDAINRRSFEAEARLCQLKAAALDPRCVVLDNTLGQSLTVPDGQVWLVTNMYRMKFAGMSQEVFMRKADARDYLLLPEGASFDDTSPVEGTIMYIDPSVVTDPASPDFDKRYVNDPIGLYAERMEKLQSLDLLHVGATIAAGSAPGEASTALDWGASSSTWGLGRFVGVENGSWMVIWNTTLGVNLIPEIADDHASRLHAFPILLPFLKSQFTTLRLKYGSASGNGVDNQFGTAWGVFSWSALDEDTW